MRLTLQRGVQYERAEEERVAILLVDGRALMSLGSLVQFPEGLSSAPSAEHWACGLRPIPHVIFLNSPFSGKQQLAIRNCLASVIASSKKSMSSLAKAISAAAALEEEMVVVGMVANVVVVMVVVVVVLLVVVEVVVVVVVVVEVAVVVVVVEVVVEVVVVLVHVMEVSKKV